MSKTGKGISRIVLPLLAGVALPVAAQAQDAGGQGRAAVGQRDGSEDIVVTARQRQETLQRVPDAITAFTATKIENSGIRKVADFMALTPNLTFRTNESFQNGDIRIAMRGISNGLLGWSSVNVIVDGVPASSLQEIDASALSDIERIEVLRGPQSALYGAGAIAGAINLVTRAPSNAFEGKAMVSYEEGNDLRVAATSSGALIQDKLFVRLNGSLRDSDGLIKSASNGINLDFVRQQTVSLRVIAKPVDDLQIDLRGAYLHDRSGALYQDKIATADQINSFGGNTRARRDHPGVQKRDLYQLSARVQLDTELGTLASVTGYTRLNQRLDNGSICYDDPNDPAVIATPTVPGSDCMFAPAFGNAAQPGEVIDNVYLSRDRYRTLTQDIRFVSNSDQAVRWVLGASYLRRKRVNGFDAGLTIAPTGAFFNIFPSWDRGNDRWWGAYAQLSIDLASNIELTGALRYDDQRYRNTRYTDSSLTTVLPVFDSQGRLVATQQRNKNSVQPKGQLSFRPTEKVMTYATVSKGFRAGFFSTGNYTAAEKTINYEIGLKSQALDNALTFNAALFHIDYSNQQLSIGIATPPFLVPVTIPKTRINGAETELTLRAAPGLTLGGSLSYLDSQIAGGGGRPPYAPKWSGTATLDYVHELATDLRLRFHADGRWNGPIFLGQAETQRIPDKTFVNLRLGVEFDRYRITAFARNALNTRQTEIDLFPVAGGFVRARNKPRSLGVEGVVTF